MTMAFSKIATIVVLTDELVRFSNPAAEALVRDDMARAITLFTDQQFIDPSITAVSNVSPASITNGITENTYSGTTIAQITADVATLWKVLLTGNIAPTAPVFVMNPRTALYLSLVRTTQDIIAFPGLSMMGGTFFGIPVVTSNAVPIESDGTTSIVFMDAANIFLADDGGITLDVSMEASLQMDGAPSTGAQQLVSLWQNNMVGLRAERYVNYQRRREAAVAVLSQVTY
jgi:HK97 family phage major capsid protein